MDRTLIGDEMHRTLDAMFQEIGHATIDFFQLRSVELPRDFEDAI